MVRNFEGEKLDTGLEEVEACSAPVMRNFAAGLKKDLNAVRAGLTESLSNGLVEGFVHKLKLLKPKAGGEPALTCCEQESWLHELLERFF